MTDKNERSDIFVNPRNRHELPLVWVFDGETKSGSEAISSGVLVEVSPSRIYKMWVKDYSDYDAAKEIDVASDVIERYLKLKSMGFPVVDTLRVSSDGKKVLMTDVTKSGKCEVVDFHGYFDESVRIANYDELIEDINVLYKKGTDHGLLFPHLAVVVDKDTKVGRVMILDLAEVSDYVQGDWNEENVSLNNRWMEELIDLLSGLKQ